jgi:DNA-binding transcriptional ArsR family regulator
MNRLELAQGTPLTPEMARDVVSAAIRASADKGTGEHLYRPATLEAWRVLSEQARPDFYDLLAELPYSDKATVRGALRDAQGAPSGTPPPRTTTAAELLARDFAPIEWIVPGLLPEGLMLLAARPKIGKSWLALQLAVAAATNGRLFGRRVREGRVLYLALEDNDRRLAARLAKLQATGPGLERLHLVTQWPRGREGASAIAAWIADHPDACLVVVDVLTKLRESRSSREGGYATDFDDVALLKPPPGSSVAVLAVHHTRKSTADDPLDEVSGTLGIAGAADGAWVLKRARGQDEAELHVIGRDVEQEGASAVRFDRDACRWEWMGEAWRVQLTVERRLVLDALADGPMKPAEIARAIGKNDGAVRKVLSGMVAAGQVDRGLDGRYRPIQGSDDA